MGITKVIEIASHWETRAHLFLASLYHWDLKQGQYPWDMPC